MYAQAKSHIRLLFMLADVRNRTDLAFRGTCGANLTPEHYKTVAKIRLLFGENKGDEYAFYFERIFQRLGVQPDAAADAYAVGVGDDRRFFVDVAEQEIGNLASDSGEFQKLVHGVGKNAAVLVAEHDAGILNVFSLGLIESARAKDFLEL